MANKDNKLWILFGVIAFIILIGRTGFLGSFITTCDNFEPLGISGYIEEFDKFNETVVSAGLENISFSYNLTQYSVDSHIGFLYILETPENISCSQVFDVVQQDLNTSNYFKIDTKTILQTDSAFYWCNKDNSMILKSLDLTTISNYYDLFENCTTIDTEALISNEDDCVAADGIWNNTECVCPDDSNPTINEVCAIVETTTSTNLTSGTTLSSGSNSLISEDASKKTIIVIGAIVGLFLLFYYSDKQKEKTKGRKK